MRHWQRAGSMQLGTPSPGRAGTAAVSAVNGVRDDWPCLPGLALMIGRPPPRPCVDDRPPASQALG